MCAGASDSVIRSKIEEIVRKFPNLSTPGYPFSCTGANTNEKLMYLYRENVVQAILKVFKFYRDSVPEDFKTGHLQKLQNGQRYPYIFSIKKEAHPKRKVIARKWRVIIPSGIINQGVERLIVCGFQSALDVSYGTTMQATKIGFDDEGTQTVGRMYEEKVRLYGCPAVGSDASGWDVSVCEVGHYTFGDVLVSTCIGKREDVLNYQNLVRAMCLENSDPLFVHQGAVFRQAVPGMVHSGCYVTTPGNGVQRGYLVHKSGGDWSITRGDDCLEWNTLLTPEKLADYYTSKMGLKVRDVSVFSKDSFQFCSHLYRCGVDGIWTAALTSWKKSVVTFLSKKKPLYDDLNVLMYEMRHNDLIERWVAHHICSLHLRTVYSRR